ncbi:hypothetical protein [Amycolatopsis sp. NPDC004625]
MVFTEPGEERPVLSGATATHAGGEGPAAGLPRFHGRGAVEEAGIPRDVR